MEDYCGMHFDGILSIHFSNTILVILISAIIVIFVRSRRLYCVNSCIVRSL